MVKEPLSSMDEDEGNKCDEDFRFADVEDDEDDMAYFKDDMGIIMDGSSTYSGKIQNDNPYNLYFDEDPKEDNQASKYFGAPVKKNRSAYNLFIKDKVMIFDDSFQSDITTR